MRIFSVRINLDEMFARLDGLSPAEESAWLYGFRIGSRGKPLPVGTTRAMECGHDFGRQAYREADGLKSRQSTKGKQRHSRKPAEPPAEPPAGSQPEVQPRPQPQAAISSNPVIQESSNLIIQGSTPARTTPDIFDGMDQDEVPIAMAVPVPQDENFRDWRSQHPVVFIARRGDDGDLGAWESLFRYYGHECFDGVYLVLNRAKPKYIYYNQVVKWLHENTKVPNAET